MTIIFTHYRRYPEQRRRSQIRQISCR